MFNSLCLLIITTLSWHHVASRHLPAFYSPYSDYSYTYSGPGPLYHQQHHSPFFAPPGTYFDQRQGILRPFPGGGVPVLVDYHKLCSNHFVGLKAHPDQHQYYYVCKPDCVIFGKCQNLQIFNATCGQCVQHPPPEYKPSCSGIGRFPLFSNCHLYYKCEKDLQPKIYSCPASMIFSPASQQCINGNICTPTQISPHSSYIPESCGNSFPPCFENGTFRSPADCSLHYKCDLKSNGIFMQTRLRCPRGQFYHLQKKECLAAKDVPCDSIQVAELVYPKPNTLHLQHAIYPAQFELDALEEGQYPVEHMNEELTINNCNATNKSTEEDVKEAVDTTLAPTNLNHEDVEQNDSETAVLSDYIDFRVDDDNNEILSKELGELPPSAISSEELEVSTESSSSETDSEDKPTHQLQNENLTTEDDQSASQNENESENEIENEVFTEEKKSTMETVTLNDFITETTDQPHTATEHSKNISTEESFTSTETEINSTNHPEVETTAAPTKVEQEEETTTTRVSTRSIKSQPCENIMEIVNATDKNTHDTSQTRTEKCLQELTFFISDTNHTPSLSRNTLHPQTITTIPTTSQLNTIKITPVSDNLVVMQSPSEEKKLLTNLLDSEGDLETLEDIQSLENAMSDTEETGNSLDEHFMQPTIPKATAGDTEELTQPLHKHPTDFNSTEKDTSFEEDFSDETKQISNKLDQESGLDRETDKATQQNSQNFHKEELILQSSPKALEDDETVQPAALGESDSSENNSTNAIEDHEQQTLLNNEMQKDVEAAAQIEKDLDEAEFLSKDSSSFEIPNQVNKTTNVKSIRLEEINFSDEELIPVHSKSMPTNKPTEETTDSGERFEDDYTTIISEKELTSTEASADAGGITHQEEHSDKSVNTTEKETTLKRRQVAIDETTPTTLSKKPANVTFAPDTADSNSEQSSATAETEAENSNNDKSLTNDVFTSDILDFNSTRDGQSEEVSNNEITSADTIPLITNSKQPTFPHTPSPNFTTTQVPKATPKITTSEPSEKQTTNNLILHIRKTDHEQPSSDSLPSQSLYCILRTKPVINHNDTKSNNETFAAPPSIQSNNENIPRLEIIAERPIDVHFSICPIACSKNHTRKASTLGKRAVLLKWFANKSNQTLAFETANELHAGDD